MTTLAAKRDSAENRTRVVPEVPEGSQILIVGDDLNASQLENTFQEMGIALKSSNSMTEACECARSGRFQAVLSKPLLRDGSWRRLIDIANHYDLGFEVVLVSRGFDLAASAEALNEGAFDVLETLHNHRKAAEVARRALWTAYLKGAGPNPTAGGPQNAA